MPLATHSLGELIEALGARTPTPGGGAAASTTAAIGAALGSMVINWSLQKEALEAYRQDNASHLEQLQRCATDALRLADEDAIAYEDVNRLMKLPADSPERQAGWTAAVEAAMAAPLATLELCNEVTGILARLVGTTNQMLISDLAAAAVLIEAAARTASWNVRANLSLVEDQAQATHIETDMSDRLKSIIEQTADIEQDCQG